MQKIIEWILLNVFVLDINKRWVESLNFFISDSISIIVLLFVMITFIGFFRTYIPQQKLKKWLSNKRYGTSNLVASMFGAITPFCSCSSIPIFLSFIKAGVPLGVTFSFLITSPIVNEYLVVLMFALFGAKITIAYVISGILIGTISGIVIEKLKLDKYILKDIRKKSILKENKKLLNIKERFNYGINEGKAIIKKLWIWIIVGVGIGAIIHNYVPNQAISNIGGIFAVPIAVLLGVPLYGSCAAIVPIAVALFNKGVSLGTALAFMMAISALSFPEAVILRRVMKLKLIAIFFGIVTVAIIFTGYLFNLLEIFLV